MRGTENRTRRRRGLQTSVVLSNITVDVNPHSALTVLQCCGRYSHNGFDVAVVGQRVSVTRGVTDRVVANIARVSSRSLNRVGVRNVVDVVAAWSRILRVSSPVDVAVVVRGPNEQKENALQWSEPARYRRFNTLGQSVTVALHRWVVGNELQKIRQARFR